MKHALKVFPLRLIVPLAVMVTVASSACLRPACAGNTDQVQLGLAKGNAGPGGKNGATQIHQNGETAGHAASIGGANSPGEYSGTTPASDAMDEISGLCYDGQCDQ